MRPLTSAADDITALLRMIDDAAGAGTAGAVPPMDCDDCEAPRG